MKQIIFLSIILLGCAGVNYAQVRGRPEPTPISRTQNAINRANDLNRRSAELRNTEKFPVRTNKERKIYQKNIKPLFRKATKEEQQFISPSDEDSAKYSSYLDKKRTGIIRLVADVGCAKDSKIVSALPKCSGYTMPGAGSAYSFRFNNYRIQHLSDLNFKNNTFQALGVLTHGILVNLGDVPIDGVNLKSRGLRFVTGFKPVRNMAGAAKFANKLTKGVDNDGFRYASVMPVKSNSTYILRSVAYRGFSPRKTAGIIYNELGQFGDRKRKDVIIAFRVVRFAPSEAVTIIWKQLKSKKSPEIKN